MRHTVHIMLDSNVGQLLCNIKEYIIKYGESNEKDYFRAILYQGSDDKSSFSEALLCKDNGEKFVPGLDNIYSAELVEQMLIPLEGRQEYLSAFFAKLYTEQLTINNPGDSSALHVCFYIPIYKIEYWNIVKECVDAINALKQSFNIDLFLFSDDLAFIFETELDTLPLKQKEYQKQSKDTINNIVSYSKSKNAIKHMILMQNCNNEGISLELDKESFVRILGEYALLSVSNYSDIYNPSADSPDRIIHSLGISVLSFDKYYFVQYLLHKAYIHILDREKVCQTEVDVNKVSPIIQDILKDRVNIFSSFYDKKVKPLVENGKDQNAIISKINDDLKKELDDLTQFFQAFIDRNDLSLPEKKAALAQLLGEDDELLVGYMFNRDQYVIDDCSKDVLDYFINLNNKLLNPSYIYLGGDEVIFSDKEKKELNKYASLSNNSNDQISLASSMIDGIKSTKIQIREATNYIRHKSNELESVESSIKEINNSDKRLTKDGFVFEGKKYRLMHPQQEDIKINDYYVPKTNFSAQVDLRQFFTPVKDQGQIGSCSVFSIVSIFEYILKSNKSCESDLSEKFVYYNVRKTNGQQGEDTGCTLYQVIDSIREEGVCSEKLCVYDEKIDEQPSDEAYNEAKINKITKALRVNGNLDDIKSAVHEGYPVAIVLKIYDSFEPNNGFISTPSSEDKERKDGHGNHAMVICGYSDDEKVFIVRNSWSEKFGDKGYCYIPYSYISDPELLDQAYIVTEISNKELRVANKDNKTIVSFDTSNSQIKAAILMNLISEEKIRLDRLNVRYNEKSKELNSIIQELGNNNTRQSIYKGSERRIEIEKNKLEVLYNKKQEERKEKLKKFDSNTRCADWAFGGMIAFILFSFAIMTYYSTAINEMLFSDWSYVIYVLISLYCVFFGLWRWQRKSKRVELDEDLKKELSSIKSDIASKKSVLGTLKLKCHVASTLIDSLSKFSKILHSKYNAMGSYVGNLRIWRDEEKENLKMKPLNKAPLLSLISNVPLDRYFEENKDTITEEIKLSSMFKSQYNIDENKIIQFKNELKTKLMNCLWEKVKDFSIYSYILSKVKYQYMDNSNVNIATIISELDLKSNVFVRTNSIEQTAETLNAHSKLLFIPNPSESYQAEWDSKVNSYFRNKPNVFTSESKYKISLLQVKGMLTEEINLLS